MTSSIALVAFGATAVPTPAATPVVCTVTDVGFDFNNATPSTKQVSGTYAMPAECCAACGANDDGKLMYFTHTGSASDTQPKNACWCHTTNDGKTARQFNTRIRSPELNTRIRSFLLRSVSP